MFNLSINQRGLTIEMTASTSTAVATSAKWAAKGLLQWNFAANVLKWAAKGLLPRGYYKATTMILAVVLDLTCSLVVFALWGT